MNITEIRRLVDLGDPQTALRQATQILDNHTSDVYFLCLYSKVLMMCGRLDEAIKYIGDAEAIDANNIEVEIAYARLAYFKRNFGESMSKATRLIQKEPYSSEAHVILGANQRATGEYKQAISTLTRAIELLNKNADALINRGLALISLGDNNDGYTDLIRAYEIRPHFSQIWPFVAKGFLEFRNYTEGKKLFQKLVKANPGRYEYVSGYAFCLQNLRQFEQAIKLYLDVLEVLEPNAELLNNLALCYYDCGDLDRAIEFYTRALALDMTYIPTILNSFSLKVQLRECGTEFNNVIYSAINEMRIYLEKIPKFLILSAIEAYIYNKFEVVKKCLQLYYQIDMNNFIWDDPADQRFCSAYGTLLQNLTKLPLPLSETDKKVFHLGESHSLTFTHRSIPDENFAFSSLITFGAKAFHLGAAGNNRYKATFHKNLELIPDNSHVYISIGEIDCRQDEGFISASLKHKKPIEDIIQKTVCDFVSWINQINVGKKHRITFFNLPAPYLDRRYSVNLNRETAKVVKLYNECLITEIQNFNFDMIDVYNITLNSEGFSNMIYHIDNRHLSPIVLHHSNVMNKLSSVKN